MNKIDISQCIKQYEAERFNISRYASFDYCFNYFQHFRTHDNIESIANEDNLENSVLQLGLYLASWGMYRGSTALLRHSSHALIPVIKIIAGTHPSIWAIDVPDYGSKLDKLTALYEEIGKALHFPLIKTGKAKVQRPSHILVTKIMLGVFGNTPAMDDFFCRGFDLSVGLGDFQKTKEKVVNAWKEILEIYEQNKKELNSYAIHSLPFGTRQERIFKYPVGKLIDMAYFQRGNELLQEK